MNTLLSRLHLLTSTLLLLLLLPLVGQAAGDYLPNTAVNDDVWPHGGQQINDISITGCLQRAQQGGFGLASYKKAAPSRCSLYTQTNVADVGGVSVNTDWDLYTAPFQPNLGPVPANIDLSNWMTQLADWIQWKPLNTLMLPATHDSGTYGLIDEVDRPADDVTGPDITGEGAKQFGLFFSQAWAKAQDQTIAQQLNDGIRVLDLRPCKSKDGTIRICHGLYGPTLDDILGQVRTFADAHPREIIVLQFDDWAGIDDVQPVVSLIESKLGPHLLNHQVISAQSTVSAIWAQPGANVAVVFFNKETSKFWSAYKVYGYNDASDKAMKQATIANSFSRAPNQLHFIFGQATPNMNTVIAAANIGYPKNLQDLANGTNPVVLGWIRDQWSAQPINVVALDFYKNTCLVQLAIYRNTGPQSTVSLAGCSIGDNSTWDNWPILKNCPDGFRDDGVYCAKPTDKGRGAGYPWKFGDGFNSDGMYARCQADHGNGNCEAWGAVVYPKCQVLFGSNYHNVACCLCSADCPGGMTDIGVSCKK